MQVYWRGFPEPSWEPVETIFTCAPEAIWSRLTRCKTKIERQVRDFLETAKLQVNLVQGSERSSYLRQVIFPNQEIRRTYPGNWVWIQPEEDSRGWNAQEQSILDACVRKYGVCNPDLVAGYLPSKTKSQIYSKLQRAYGIQKLGVIHGLRLSQTKVKDLVSRDRVRNLLTQAK